MNLRRALIATIALGLSAFAAQAQTIDAKAKSGTASLIGGFFAFAAESCYAGPVSEARTSQQPRHGRIEIRRVQGRLSEGQCVGSVVRGLQFYYTAAKGFRGADEVRIDIPWNQYVDAPSASVRTHVYRITVE